MISLFNQLAEEWSAILFRCLHVKVIDTSLLWATDPVMG